ncbi:MAG: Neocarzinostatin family [Actinomycetia bacterium]|nr:Neocarzinostatin family [Actinomycetes bacterium]
MFRGRVRRVVLAVFAGTVLAVGGITASGGVVGKSSHPNPTPTVTVLPKTGLADLQQVTLAGTGFSPRVQIATIQCRLGAVDQGGCDLGTLITTNSDSSGAFTLKRAVRRIINVSTEPKPVDCAKAKCILAGANIGNLGEAAAEKISFDKSIPPVPTTITVTPNKNLIDHQLVTITGKGFTPTVFVQVSECPSATPTDCANNYDNQRSVAAASNGTFTIKNFAVQRLVTFYSIHGETTVDCGNTPGTCVIGAIAGSYGGSTPITAPLSFNASVPPAVASVQVTPSTGLTDLQVVTIIGTGFLPGSSVDLEQCGSNGFNSECDYNNVQFVTAGLQGEFLVSFPVHRLVAVYGLGGVSNADCATQVGACSIQTFSSASHQITVPLSFNPAVKPVQPTVSASPSTGLADNQHIGVTLGGFAQDRPITVVECSALAMSHSDLSYCDFNTATTATWPAGGGAPSTTMAVHRTVGGGSGLTDCSAHTGACVLAAFSSQYYGGYGAPARGAAGAAVNGAAQRGATKAARAALGSKLSGVGFTPISFTQPPK